MEEDSGSCKNNSQFKFTQLWNGIIQHLQENVEVKRRKHKMRSYDNCFTGTDAVEILHHYLEHHGGLDHNVTHENVVKVCQLLMESNVFEAISCSTNSIKKQIFEDSSSIYYRFIGIVPDKKPTTTPCWCEDQRHQDKKDRMHSCCRSPCKQLNTPSRKRKRGTSFNFGKQKPETFRSDYENAFTPIERNSKRRSSFGVGKFKVPAEPRDTTSAAFDRGKKSRATFGVGRFKAEIRFGESSPDENVFERKSLRRSSFGFGRRNKERQSFRSKPEPPSSRVIENPCTIPRADILQNILCQPVELSHPTTSGIGTSTSIGAGAEFGGSTSSLCSSTSAASTTSAASSHNESYRESMRPKRMKLDEGEVNNIWKEATIQRLLRLVEIPILDDILDCAETFVYDQSSDIHRSGIYMSAVKRRSPRLAKPEPDSWLAAAHDCLEAHPEGQIIIGNYHGNTPASNVLVQARKQLLYRTITKLFADRERPLIPNQLIQVMQIIVALLARGKTLRAIELTQIVVMLMPSKDRWQLKGLLSFMAEASKEENVKISFEAFNRMTVIQAFTSSIISYPILTDIQSKNIVAFMMDCQEKVFKVPESIKVAVLGRIHRIEHGLLDLCKVYCNRISSREFDYQKGEGTRQALRKMTNSIIDDTRLSLKDKKQYLQRFKKDHGELYHKYFANLM